MCCVSARVALLHGNHSRQEC